MEKSKQPKQTPHPPSLPLPLTAEIVDTSKPTQDTEIPRQDSPLAVTKWPGYEVQTFKLNFAFDSRLMLEVCWAWLQVRQQKFT